MGETWLVVFNEMWVYVSSGLRNLKATMLLHILSSLVLEVLEVTFWDIDVTRCRELKSLSHNMQESPFLSSTHPPHKHNWIRLYMSDKYLLCYVSKILRFLYWHSLVSAYINDCKYCYNFILQWLMNQTMQIPWAYYLSFVQHIIMMPDNKLKTSRGNNNMWPIMSFAK